MSRRELQRLTDDLGADAAFAEELRALGDDPGAWKREAAARGYELTMEEARGLSSSYRELSDDELEDVAGGWDGGGTGGTGGSSGGGGGG